MIPTTTSAMRSRRHIPPCMLWTSYPDVPIMDQFWSVTVSSHFCSYCINASKMGVSSHRRVCGTMTACATVFAYTLLHILSCATVTFDDVIIWRTFVELSPCDCHENVYHSIKISTIIKHTIIPSCVQKFIFFSTSCRRCVAACIRFITPSVS
jgi:hypothetical protein